MIFLSLYLHIGNDGLVKTDLEMPSVVPKIDIYKNRPPHFPMSDCLSFVSSFSFVSAGMYMVWLSFDSSPLIGP